MEPVAREETAGVEPARVPERAAAARRRRWVLAIVGLLLALGAALVAVRSRSGSKAA